VIANHWIHLWIWWSKTSGCFKLGNEESGRGLRRILVSVLQILSRLGTRLMRGLLKRGFPRVGRVMVAVRSTYCFAWSSPMFELLQVVPESCTDWLHPWLLSLPAAVDVAASLSFLDCMNKYLFHSLEKTMTLFPALFSPVDDCIVLDVRSECRYSRAVNLSSWYYCGSWTEGLVRALTVSDGDNSPGQNWTVGAHRLLRLHGSRLQSQFSASSRPAQWMLVHECQPSECPCKWARPCMPMPLRQPSECTCKHASPVHALANMPAQCVNMFCS